VFDDVYVTMPDSVRAQRDEFAAFVSSLEEVEAR
jgi:hypothetical protein